MTTFRHEEIVIRRVEYGFAAPCDIGTFEKMKSVAFQDYCERNGLSRESSLSYSDDWAEVRATDEEIVISFVVHQGREVRDVG
jgi:hypothetical protein